MCARRRRGGGRGLLEKAQRVCQRTRKDEGEGVEESFLHVFIRFPFLLGFEFHFYEILFSFRTSIFRESAKEAEPTAKQSIIVA